MRRIKIHPKFSLKPFLVLLAVFAGGKGWCVEPSYSNDPLLDLFIKKGYVSQAEADKVKAEADALRTNDVSYTMPKQSIWDISDNIQKLQLYGDVRVRYENRTAKDPAGGGIDLYRLRYALRFGLRGELLDSFYYGFRVDTGANPRSPWITMGSSSSSSPYQGPFGKSSAGLAVGQIYLGWHPTTWFDFTLGKMPNPLYTTPMVWDSDINPEGAAERFKYTVGNADLFANFGQFAYGDLNPDWADKGLGINGLPGLGQNNENIFMFAEQAGFNFHFTTNISAKIAATLYSYTGLKRTSQYDQSSLSPYFGDPYIGEGAYYYYGGSSQGYGLGNSGYSPGTSFNLPTGGYGSLSFPFNQVGLNHLMVVEVPFEFDFKIKKVAARVFGDVAYNLDGAQRARDAAAAYSQILSQNPTLVAINHPFSAQTDDVKAYQIGFGIGSSDLVYGPTQGLVYGSGAHKHDWEFRMYWQHVEQYALDPNLLDSDFFEGRENLEGIYFALAYAFTDNVIGTVRYGYASRINDTLGTGGSNQDLPQMNPINHIDLLQVDATIRF
ncbi:MAG TPA: putative porin [Verrucomicrobiae bacterium]|nr:putative porin [Verrucomicrobiae bacterium]